MLNDLAVLWLGFIIARINVYHSGRFTDTQELLITLAIWMVIMVIGEWGLGVELAFKPLVAGMAIGALDVKYGSRCGVRASRITAGTGEVAPGQSC